MYDAQNKVCPNGTNNKASKAFWNQYKFCITNAALKILVIKIVNLFSINNGLLQVSLGAITKMGIQENPKTTIHSASDMEME